MNFSNRAKLYLSKLSKHKQWSTSEEETSNYLFAQNITPTQGILEFQANYSGLELTINGHKSETFSSNLFSRNQIKNNELLDLDKKNNKLFFPCGHHATAQFMFFVTGKCEICTLDNSENFNIIHSNFRKMIEQYALLNQIWDWKKNPFYFKLLKLDQLIDHMKYSFQFIEETSDDYSLWWQNENIIISTGTWFDRPSKYLLVFGKNQNIITQLLEILESKSVI